MPLCVAPGRSLPPGATSHPAASVVPSHDRPPVRGRFRSGRCAYGAVARAGRAGTEPGGAPACAALLEPQGRAEAGLAARVALGRRRAPWRAPGLGVCHAAGAGFAPHARPGPPECPGAGFLPRVAPARDPLCRDDRHTLKIIDDLKSSGRFHLVVTKDACTALRGATVQGPLLRNGVRAAIGSGGGRCPCKGRCSCMRWGACTNTALFASRRVPRVVIRRCRRRRRPGLRRQCVTARSRPGRAVTCAPGPGGRAVR